MKKFYFALINCFIFFIPAAFAQRPVMELTFSAGYYGQYVPLDSIYIENLTQGGDTTLFYPDTLMVLDYLIGISENPVSNEDGFVVMQNNPNPFSEQTGISIFLPKDDHLQVSVMNLLGQKLAYFEKSLNAGNHSFIFYPGDEKQYFLSATARGITKAIKMLSINSNSRKSALLIYQGIDETPDGFKSGKGIDGFGYSLGDQLRFIGYARTLSNIAGSDVIEAAPEGNEDYGFEIIEGLPCTGITTVTYEGKTYTTVQIGNQCWFKENLAYLPNVSPSSIGSSNEPYYYVP